MQCKREGCDKELGNPRAMFCGDACRMAHARSAKKSPEHPNTGLPEQSDPNAAPEHNHFTPVETTVMPGEEPVRAFHDIPLRVASLEDYNAHPDDYAFRACAELLNWGSWMSADELKFSSFSVNRQIVPGDWDYVGEMA